MKEIVKISGKEQSLPNVPNVKDAPCKRWQIAFNYIYFTVRLGHFKTYLCQFELSYTLLGNYVTRISVHIYIIVQTLW